MQGFNPEQVGEVVNDIIIGMAAGYSWSDLAPFVISLRKSGYEGRIVLINAQIPHEQAFDYKVEVCVAELTEHCIVARFAIIPKIIEMFKDPGWCILVDTKDILFQSNPVEWLDRYAADSEIVVAEEMNVYHSCWGARTCAQQAFGESVYQSIKGCTVLNAGFIAGKSAAISRLSEEIHQMCQTDLRGQGVTYEQQLCDQTAMNRILRQPEWLGRTQFVKPGDRSFISEGNFPVDIREWKVCPKGAAIPFMACHQWQNNPETRGLGNLYVG